MGSSPKIIQHAIVTYARSWSSLAAVRSLGKRGLRVFSADTAPLGAATFSKYSYGSFVYPDPFNEKKFVSFLVKKCEEIREKYGGEILILPIHEETYVLAKHAKKFPKYVNFVFSDFKTLNSVQNKGLLIGLAKKNKVNMPNSYLVKTSRDISKVEKKIRYPVFIKHFEGSGSVGIFKADSVQEYRKILKKQKFPLVVQEYVAGDDYCCCALFKNGKKIALFNYTAIQTYPVRGGTTVYRKNISHPGIDREAMKLLKGTKWTGVAELDFRVDKKTGKAYLIEVNPRFWGGLNQAVESNLDFPYLVWRMAEGHKLEEIKKFDQNVRTRNFAGALASTIQEMLENDTLESSFRNYLKNPSRTNFRQLARDAKVSIPGYGSYLKKNFFSQKAIDDIYKSGDVIPMAGILFPLSVYIKYGKVNAKLLVSSSPKKELAPR